MCIATQDKKTTVKDQMMRLEDDQTQNDRCDNIIKRFKEVFTGENGELTEGTVVGTDKQVLESISTIVVVVRLLRKLDTTKPMGPDNISPRVL